IDDSTLNAADAPEIEALSTGAVTILPGADNIKQVITYIDESSNEITLIASNGTDGTWSLDQTPENVEISSKTGLVVLGPNAVQDGSFVESIGTDAYDNTAIGSGIALADETDTQSADIIAPTLEISAADLNLAAGESTIVTFTFSEEVTGFAAGDITVAGGSLTGLSSTDNIT
ncbi:Ig-like domain-containing protein, partial [Acinetobacter indicus]|uniref:Ig-like domain-containing protein n=1 Tax=Acinetobacter indicus TaxID=756892 RepID=UPI001D1897A9